MRSPQSADFVASCKGLLWPTSATLTHHQPIYPNRNRLTHICICVQTGEDEVHAQAAAAYEGLVLDATQSGLLELPPGAPYLHMSPAVLLRGSLRTMGMAVETGGQPGRGESRKFKDAVTCND